MRRARSRRRDLEQLVSLGFSGEASLYCLRVDPQVSSRARGGAWRRKSNRSTEPMGTPLRHRIRRHNRRGSRLFHSCRRDASSCGGSHGNSSMCRGRPRSQCPIRRGVHATHTAHESSRFRRRWQNRAEARIARLVGADSSGVPLHHFDQVGLALEGWSGCHRSRVHSGQADSVTRPQVRDRCSSVAPATRLSRRGYGGRHPPGALPAIRYSPGRRSIAPQERSKGGSANTSVTRFPVPDG